MPYTLGARQTKLYTERVDLYQPVESVNSVQTYTLKYSNVSCMFVPTPNFDVKTGAMRSKQNSIMTSDGFHFHSSQEIGDDWVIYVRPESTRQADHWKKCLGAGRELPYRAMTQEFYVVDILALKAGQKV